MYDVKFINCCEKLFYNLRRFQSLPKYFSLEKLCQLIARNLWLKSLWSMNVNGKRRTVVTFEVDVGPRYREVCSLYKNISLSLSCVQKLDQHSDVFKTNIIGEYVSKLFCNVGHGCSYTYPFQEFPMMLGFTLWIF